MTNKLEIGDEEGVRKGKNGTRKRERGEERRGGEGITNGKEREM